MAFSPSITIDASGAPRNKIPNAAFPNARELAPFFADFAAFDALEEQVKRNVRASFFATFERRFEEACARLFRSNAARVSFSRFGFARETSAEDPLVLLQCADARFGVVAPRETFLLFLCASLGFDVERICQDEIIWGDLTSGRGGNFTELEQAALNFASSRLAVLFPSESENEETNWRGEFFERPTREALETYGAEPCYWEERVLEIGAKRFPFRLCFPFSNFLGKNARFPVELDAIRDESERVEVEVEIARGVVDARRWENLKPGDVLMTDVPADALFTVLLDGKPTFRARPGVFRGVTSVQLKERIDE